MLASSLFLLFVQKLARLLLCQRIRGSVKTNAKGNAKEISVPHRTAPGAAPPLSARAAGRLDSPHTAGVLLCATLWLVSVP